MTEQRYQDADGNEVSLDKLCRMEPAWAANRIRAELATVERLRSEVERLQGWLAKIEGGDYPCRDQAQLRGWAFDALTLGHKC